MTIASEIEDLQTNLAAAKAAVTTKGGTVGDTGLAGLATEIASIPSGGGSTLPPYGKVVYYWDIRTEYDADGSGCTVTIVDMTLYGNFYETAFGSGGGMAQLMYQNGNWMYYDWEDPDEPEKIIPDISAIGLSVVFDDPDNPWGDISCSKNNVIHTESGTRYIDLDTQEKFNGLLTIQSDGYYYVDGTAIYPSAITEYYFGASVTSVSNFLSNSLGKTVDFSEATGLTSIRNCNFKKVMNENLVSLPALTELYGTVLGGLEFDFPSLTAIGNGVEFGQATAIIMPNITSVGNSFKAFRAARIGFENATSIGNNFLNSSNPIWVYLPSVLTIGDTFLGGTLSGKVGINLGQSITTIGEGFLINSNSFLITNAGPGGTIEGYYILPASITSIGKNFMFNCHNHIGQIQFNCPVSVLQATSQTDRDNCMSSNSSKSLIYTQGFMIQGNQQSSWKSAFSTIARNGRYRKLNSY